MFEGIRNRLSATLAAVLLLAPVAQAAGPGDSAGAQPPPAGLMWNRTGLPAVFPLQVKTSPGPDYMLTLIDAETGTDALAAYIEGGAFFKVLVPPGTFRLQFATGAVWHGEEDLFGPGENTRVFELRAPLTFETRGVGVKAGHVVDLTSRAPGRLAGVTVRDQLICQSFRPQFPSSDETFPRPPALRYSERSERLRDAQIPKRDRRLGFVPRYDMPARRDVRSRYCG
ncbi:hypothetical protein [Roseovarius sp. D22-M7]|uniref:hypothetical protein n=1 Tax=Roseovarius sp. D22-M7 TaxID=3127116 RepID=UPI00301022B0